MEVNIPNEKESMLKGRGRALKSHIKHTDSTLGAYASHKRIQSYNLTLNISHRFKNVI